MRQSVPFIGEKQIARADDDEVQSKRRGQIIDEILSTSSDPSSWDDVIVGQPSRRASTPKVSPTIAKQVSHTEPTPPVAPDNKAHIDWVAINNDQGLHINVSGNLDKELLHDWGRLLQESRNNTISQFEIDMTKASMLGLTGMAMLLLLKDQQRSGKQDFKLRHCNQQVRKLLTWAGMEHYFEIQDSAANDDMKH